MQIREVRLCPFIAKCIDCEYGDKCKYNHDVKTYLENKGKDIADVCYVFEKYGKCPFGLSCRFSSNHIKLVDEEKFKYENIINPDKYTEGNNLVQIYNVLNSELKTKLWKRKYDFKQSDKIVKLVNDYVNSNKNSSSIKYHRFKGIIQKRNEQEDAEEKVEEKKKKRK